MLPGATSSKTAMRPTRLFAKKRTRKKTSAWISAKSNGRPHAREQFFGSQGAASPVRKIDPKTGEVIATAKPDVAGVF
jgi:hypothetical protein